MIASSCGWQSEREALLERAHARTGTDGQAQLEEAAPGARRALPPARVEVPSSPFVSDAIAKYRGMFDDLFEEEKQ